MNTLFIEGGLHAEIRKALRQWIDSYSSQLDPDFVFKLSKNGHGKHVIQADERLDNDSFYFLVNYIKYPVDIDYKVKVEGFTTGKGNDKLQNKELLVFISDEDTEYDNVMLVTEENQCYKMNFGGKLSESTEARVYQKQVLKTVDEPQILKVRITKKAKKETLEEELRADRRLKWMFIAIVALHLFNLLIIKPFSIDETLSFEHVLFFLSLGTSLWLFWDYKVLQKNARYLKCFALVAAILIYILLLAKLEWLDLSKEKTAVALFPVIFMLFQWPLRYVFKQALNKEPIIENHPRTFTNGLYTMVLLVIPVAVTLLLTGMI